MGEKQLAELNSEDLLTILHTLSNMLRFVGVSLLLPMFVSIYYNEWQFAQVFAGMALFLVCFFSLVHILLGKRTVRFKHAIISIALCWFAIGIASGVPFLFFGINPVDAFFESVSGWSGTGLTMIEFPQQLPMSLNFWRGFIQWMGGFGIVILALLFFERPETAQSLFSAEGRTEEFYLNVFQVARTIIKIYFFYTLIGILLFLASGMSLFDAVIHTFTSLATGGFSTQAIGVGYFGTNAMLITILLMVLGGISFESHRDLLKGKIKRFFANPEIRLLFAVIFLASALIFINSFFFKNYNFFDNFFYVVSAISGTGATTTISLASLPALSVFILILLMIFGSCYGSTTGALKLWRILIVFKVIRREIYKAFLPEKAIVPLRLGEKIIQESDALKALGYMLLYLSFIVFGSIIFMFAGYSLVDSIFTVASAQGNVGLNTVAGLQWFAMEPVLKILLSLHMIVGRMEILPFLIMLKSFGIIKRF